MHRVSSPKFALPSFGQVVNEGSFSRPGRIPVLAHDGRLLWINHPAYLPAPAPVVVEAQPQPQLDWAMMTIDWRDEDTEEWVMVSNADAEPLAQSDFPTNVYFSIAPTVGGAVPYAPLLTAVNDDALPSISNLELTDKGVLYASNRAALLLSPEKWFWKIFRSLARKIKFSK